MKIKEGFVLRELGGQYVVVALGEASKNFNGIIHLNETGAFLFNQLKEDVNKQQLINKILEEYEIDLENAKKDVDKFIEKLKDAKLLDE